MSSASFTTKKVVVPSFSLISLLCYCWHCPKHHFSGYYSFRHLAI